MVNPDSTKSISMDLESYKRGIAAIEEFIDKPDNTAARQKAFIWLETFKEHIAPQESEVGV